MSKPLPCFILIGLPGSGKSTLASQIINQNPHYKLISSDYIRQTLYGHYSIQGQWPQIETEILRQIKTALQTQNPVVYDATNANHLYRIELLQKLIAIALVQWIGLYLNITLETCKQRNCDRLYPVPERIIEAMAEDLAQHPPSKADGFAKVCAITQPITSSELGLILS
ncbi:MAG TPA: ATP-binding protein [Stenomitos sp.]